ncbi:MULTISPECIES: hypothetical protein [unclassified Streptomyces]|uniref:hypothetical protein n=1 Tax=unclassified Streptomyces TaxID=2593676 RepID=UPI00089D81A3|nr:MULTISPECIES: hypothetical protein [unclassified Streptomyces]PBC84612.1 hypothetical protein BX261_4606 [Streptomyces sp. 2321.6]SED37875.1 hypothetical protein SAMN05428940_4634 [Streptomyces sp. 2133.1]
MADEMTRTEMKERAQEMLLHGVANVLGYWHETQGDEIPQAQHDDFQQIMRREADRAARLFGYEEAWVN